MNDNLERDFSKMQIDIDSITRLRSSTWPLPRPEEYTENVLEPINENDVSERIFESHRELNLVGNTNTTSICSSSNSNSSHSYESNFNIPTSSQTTSTLNITANSNNNNPNNYNNNNSNNNNMGLLSGLVQQNCSPNTSTTSVINGFIKKSSSRRNAWGNFSYADLITRAISTSPEQRLTLSQIYDWMTNNLTYFKDKGDSNSSAGWKNSIRHNLSLHNRFMRVPNEGTGKSSWWMINPDARPGKSVRRRAYSAGTNKLEKRRGRVKKKTPPVQSILQENIPSPCSSNSEGANVFPASPSFSASNNPYSTFKLNGRLANNGHLPSVSPVINTDTMDNLAGNLEHNIQINNESFTNTFVNNQIPQQNYYPNYYNPVNYNNDSTGAQQYVTYVVSETVTDNLAVQYSIVENSIELSHLNGNNTTFDHQNGIIPNEILEMNQKTNVVQNETEAPLDDSLIIIDHIDDTLSCDVDALIRNGDFDLNISNDQHVDEINNLNHLNQAAFVSITDNNVANLENDFKYDTQSYQNYYNNQLNLLNNNINNNDVDINFNESQSKMGNNSSVWNNYFHYNNRVSNQNEF